MYATFCPELRPDTGHVSVGGAAGDGLLNWLDVTLGSLHLPASSYHAGAADEDVVSEGDLIAHLHAVPPALTFLSCETETTTTLGETVTGAAFAGAIYISGDLVLTFVDERCSAVAPIPQTGLTPFTCETANAESVFVLADRTVIRFTGLLKGLSRAVSGSLQFGPGFSYAS